MAAPAPSATPTRIEADIVIPGRGDPILDGCVVLRGNVIEYAGPRAGAPPTPDADAVTVAAVLPGLWDCHCHLFGIRQANLQQLATDDVALRATRIGVDAHRALLAGFTSLREVGGLGVHLARSIAEGTLPGPEIYAAGGLVTFTEQVFPSEPLIDLRIERGIGDR